MRATHLAVVVGVVALAGGLGSYWLLYQGGLDVYVSDAPGGWAHVDITFDQVQVHEAGKGEADGWHTIALQRRTVDLDAIHGTSDLLGSSKLAPGKYTEIRIVVIAATAQAINSTAVLDLTVASGDLKIVNPFDLTAGGATSVTLDFDLARCIVANGTGYTFTPVIGSVTVR